MAVDQCIFDNFTLSRPDVRTDLSPIKPKTDISSDMSHPDSVDRRWRCHAEVMHRVRNGRMHDDGIVKTAAEPFYLLTA